MLASAATFLLLHFREPRQLPARADRNGLNNFACASFPRGEGVARLTILQLLFSNETDSVVVQDSFRNHSINPPKLGGATG